MTARDGNALSLAGIGRRIRLACTGPRGRLQFPKQLLQKRALLKLTMALALVVGLAAFVFLALPQIGRLEFHRDYTWYDLGLHGFAPTRQYHSFNHTVADVRYTKQDARCSRDYVFFAPHGPKVEEHGGIITDSMGDLIWRQPSVGGAVQDLRVQEYRGEKFLTFWDGVEDSGRKLGSWYMLDETYQVRHRILPSGFDKGDMHEFHLTDNGTVLISVYEPVKADLTSIGGPSDGYILDGIFQEIDLETGDALFQWRSWDHIPLNATLKTHTPCVDKPQTAYGGCGNNVDSAFDYYHLNSIVKDEVGNYLVSGRSTATLSYIDGKTGEVIWNLGGLLNDFKDLSGGSATSFSWQHYAVFHDNGTSISLFDNGARAFFDPAKESRGMIVDIDVPNLTVTLRKEYYGPQRIRSFSQGSLQILDDTGNVFVGWGRGAAFTEFAPDGETLCDARFGASTFFSFGTVMSYRVFRDTWVGRPTHPPSVAVEGGKIYASWNGATEVDSWRLEGARKADGSNDDDFDAVSVTAKESFETEIQPDADEAYALVRVAALHDNGTVLGVSDAVEMVYDGDWLTPRGQLLLGFVGAVGGLIAVLFVSALLCHRRLRKSRQGDKRPGYQPIQSLDG